MKAVLNKMIILFIVLLLSGEVYSSDTPGDKADQEPTLLNRIDFGNAYIMGQSIKSGAVYLLQRKKSEIKSMLNYRDDYRVEILEDFEIQDPGENMKENQKNP